MAVPTTSTMPTSLYFDNATLIPPSREVLKEIWPLYETNWANPASPHDLGQSLNWMILKAYNTIQKVLGLSEMSSCIVTSSGAEATSQAIRSLVRHGVYEYGKNHLAIARFHDAATIMAAEGEKANETVEVTYIAANQLGSITKDSVIDAINPRTALIAFPLVHPLLGTIQPLEEIYEISQKRAIPLIVDISNAIGTVLLDLSLYDNVYYVLRGEAIGLPRAMGGLLIKTPSAPNIIPLIYGDEHPHLSRGGPLNIPGLIGFAECLEETCQRDILYCTEVNRLKAFFEEKLQSILGHDSVIQPFQKNDVRAPHISCLIFKGVKNEAMLYHLNKKKLYATIGGAGFQNLSDVLEGMGFPLKDAYSALSFGFSYTTKESEVHEAIERIVSVYRLLRKISTV